MLSLGSLLSIDSPPNNSLTKKILDKLCPILEIQVIPIEEPTVI